MSLKSRMVSLVLVGFIALGIALLNGKDQVTQTELGWIFVAMGIGGLLGDDL